MEIVVPKEREGHTIRVYGEEQGFQALPVRHGLVEIVAGELLYVGNVVTTAWKPTADELARLNAGEAVYIEINSSVVAPMVVTVEPAVEFDFRTMVKSDV